MEVSLFGSPTALPWPNVSADGDDVRLVLEVSEERHFGLSLYWNQVQGPVKPWWHRNLVRPLPPQIYSHSRQMPMLRTWMYYQRGLLKRTQRPTPKARNIGGETAACLVSSTLASSLPLFLIFYNFSLLLTPQTGPQTITLNHTDLVPCLCIQVGAESSWVPGEWDWGIGERGGPHYLGLTILYCPLWLALPDLGCLMPSACCVLRMLFLILYTQDSYLCFIAIQMSTPPWSLPLLLQFLLCAPLEGRACAMNSDWFETWISLFVWSWASHFTSLSLFPIRKIGRITVAPS